MGECLIPGAHDPQAPAYAPCPPKLDFQSRKNITVETLLCKNAGYAPEVDNVSFAMTSEKSTEKV